MVLVLVLIWLLVASCGIGLASKSLGALTSTRPSSAFIVPVSEESPQLPSMWVGVRFESRRIDVTVAETGAEPGPIATKAAAGPLSASLNVTDVAYDTRQGIIYVGTCCEPVSGQLWQVDTRVPASGFRPDDQGFAVDVAGSSSALARTDTWGTLGVRASSASEQDLREGAGVTDVAVDGTGTIRVVALINSQRLRALIPTVSWHKPGLLVREWKAPGAWADTLYPLPPNVTYCRLVPLKNGAVGLLAGTFNPGNPVQCTGDSLDIYDTALKRLRTRVLTFPGRVQHLSIDESSTFLIFTTVEGAVGWRTIEGRGGVLAARGFVAADW